VQLLKNKTILIALAVGLILVLGGSAAFLNSQKKPSQNTTTNTATENQSEADNLIGLLKSGKTQQCNFTSKNEDGSDTIGVVYITRDQMRSDITITENGEESEISLIRKGNENYIWGSNFPDNSGLKMTMDIEDLANNQSAKEYIDPSQKVDYDCQSWTVNNNVFTPPASVEFNDLSSFMQDALRDALNNSNSTTNSTNNTTNNTSNNTTNDASGCNICESLSGDAKDVCKNQLNCD
jgi:hypothetical protein